MARKKSGTLFDGKELHRKSFRFGKIKEKCNINNYDRKFRVGARRARRKKMGKSESKGVRTSERRRDAGGKNEEKNGNKKSQ